MVTKQLPYDIYYHMTSLESEKVTILMVYGRNLAIWYAYGNEYVSYGNEYVSYGNTKYGQIYHKHVKITLSESYGTTRAPYDSVLW